ncbi:hypothetical protein MK489_15665 [Myxococcota bacterium]|nr:hypothetical protein [Myxococcota bacterium]
MRQSGFILWLAALTLACARIPGTTPVYDVVSVTPRGPLLEVSLQWTAPQATLSSDAILSLLFPARPPCEHLLTPGTRLEYLPGGQTGSVRSGGESCEAVGIASLGEWRDRRPRPSRGGPLPRAQANFRTVDSGAGFVIVRGRFPLAARVGWVGGEDTLALITDLPRCGAVVERGVASMEYRPAGKPALSLVDSQGPCSIAGFARPAILEALGKTPSEGRDES